LSDGVSEQERLRAFYSRLAAAFIAPEDRNAFEEQVRRSTITSVDTGHDRFHFSSALEERYSLDEDTVDALYNDSDGNPVTVTVHLVGGRINWAERYRDFGDAIDLWPPPDYVPMRLSRGGPPM